MSRKYDWPALLEAQTQSGLTQVEFCRQNHLCPSHFSQQKRKAASTQSGQFVRAVPTAGDTSSLSILTISLGSVSLRFGSDTDPAYVAKLVAALS